MGRIKGQPHTKPRARSQIVTTVVVDLLTQDAVVLRRWSRARGWSLAKGVRYLLSLVAATVGSSDGKRGKGPKTP